MSGFEFYFSFFGLLLGLAVANVATGFGRLWRAKGKVAIGYCVPVLGALLLAHAVLNWVSSWQTLQQVPVSTLSFMVGLFVALPYVLVSTVMFPDGDDVWPSLDAFYLAHSRLVMAALMIPTLAGMVGYVLVFGRHYSAGGLAHIFVVSLLVPIVLLLWRNLWAHRVGLTAQLLITLWSIST